MPLQLSLMHVLVVDDDRDLLDLVTFAIRRAGMEPLEAQNGSEALRILGEGAPDLVVLDVNIGGDDGFEVLRQIRQSSGVPVIMLTARASEDDKVRGLELGADDYVTKPFSYRELIARVRTHIERRRDALGATKPAATQPARSSAVAAGGAPTVATSPTSFEVGPLRLVPASHEAFKDGQPVQLTATEFRVLHVLMERAGTVVTTRELLKRVWGYDDASSADLVRVMLFRLRRKIEDDPGEPALLHTVPGVGVMLRPR